MKTRNLLKLALVLVPAMALTFTSCKKDNQDNGKVDPTSLQTLSTDENNVEGIMTNAESDMTPQQCTSLTVDSIAMGNTHALE